MLEQALQAQQPHHKWKERAQVGIYLGQSPIHNRNVALVMHRNTGHVSPQFHVKFDKGFQTLSQQDLETNWQRNTFFTTSEDSSSPKAGEQSDQMLPQQATNSTRHSAHPDSAPQHIAMDDQSDTTQRRSNLSTTDTQQLQREPQQDYKYLGQHELPNLKQD